MMYVYIYRKHGRIASWECKPSYMIPSADYVIYPVSVYGLDWQGMM